MTVPDEGPVADGSDAGLTWISDATLDAVRDAMQPAVEVMRTMNLPEVRAALAAQMYVEELAASTRELVAGISADLTRALAPVVPVVEMVSALVSPAHVALARGVAEQWAQVMGGSQIAGLAASLTLRLQAIDGGVWERAQEVLDEHKRALPPNLAPLGRVRGSDLHRLADEGITLWAVPRAMIADELLRAETSPERRDVLGRGWRLILDDCDNVAQTCTGGPYGVEARLLQQGLHAVRAGHVAAGQALLGNVLDTIRQRFSEGQPLRSRLINHRDLNQLMNHFGDLHLSDAMVWRPVWFAYRPQTAAERDRSPAFARHAVAHAVSSRQMNRRNAVQAAMLATALLDLATLRHAEGVRIKLVI